MASLFQSFRGSAMPKRLLRYALARLDLLDSEALDLENLDLAIGRNTVLEFRDVGIKLPKLANLLNLPPTFTILKAKVILLRVTIPMDIYSSPIKIQVERVEVQLKVESKEDVDSRSNASKSPGTVDIVPNTVDLAQSFLEQQPPSEKKELEAALAAETHDVGASLVLSEDEDPEDDGTYGTGQALSLPAFLASFLQGIVDRIQVQIRGVTFQLDVSLPVEPHSTTPDLVTFKLALGQIDVEGVTTSHATDDPESPKILHREGKRHIALREIRAFLISEANVFSTFERSASLAPSLSPQSSTASGLRSRLSRESSSASGFRDQQPQGDQIHTREADVVLRGHEVSDLLQDSEPEPELEPPASSMSTPRASLFQNSCLLPDEQVCLPAALDDSSPLLDHSMGEEQLLQAFIAHEETQSGEGQTLLAGSLHSNSSSGSSTQEAAEEDLTQSHLYSHEEAESMYMSAFSQAYSLSPSSSIPGQRENGDTTSPISSPRGNESMPSLVSSPPDPVEEDQIQQITPQHRPESPEAPDQQTSQQYSSNPASLPFTDRPGSPPRSEPHDDRPRLPDECSTPRGPARLAKNILALDSVSIYIPSAHKNINVVTPEGEPLPAGFELPDATTVSNSPHMPGAFSVYSAAPSTPSPPASPEPIETETEPTHSSSIDISLTPLNVQFDASVGFILAMVISRLMALVGSSEKSSAQPKSKAGTQESQGSPTTPPNISVSLEAVSLLFLEQLGGVAEAPELLSGLDPTRFDADVLLQAQLRNLHARSSTDETTVNIEGFTFGYSGLDANIISFDRSREMAASVKDAIPSPGSEVSIKFIKTASSTAVDVATLPLHICMDLRRLDETFGWFGGLSSFLSMGSSITSLNATSNLSPPPKTLARPASRGVKFDTPINPDDRSAMSENKVNLRINAIQLDLIGRDCSVVVETSAFKLVSRPEGIGIGLRKIQLKGPFSDDSGSHPPVSVTVMGTRVEFSQAPKEVDLERLLELISPSKLKDTQDDDEIMVDTLLRQRRKGSVLRLNFDKVAVDVSDIPRLSCLPSLGEDLARLGTVAKYLPEDDRPGLMTLALVRNAELTVDIGGRFGVVTTSTTHLDAAHITVPSLVAVATRSLVVTRNQIEELIGSSLLSSYEDEEMPVLMLRLIGGVVEPTITIKMRGLNLEYRVPTIIDLLNLGEDATPQDFEAGLAASVAHLGEQAHSAIAGTSVNTPGPSLSGQDGPKIPVVQVVFLDCVLGLNPLGMASKMAIVLSNSCLTVELQENGDASAECSIKQASILLIDDVAVIDIESTQTLKRHAKRPSDTTSFQAQRMDSVLCDQGFVSICQIRAALAKVKATHDEAKKSLVEVAVQDNFLVLETCADSTQTLIALANALKPPTPPSKENKFKTEIMPIEDMLASISENAFGRAEGEYDFDDDFGDPEYIDGYEEDVYGDGSDLTEIPQPHDRRVREEIFNASSSMISDVTTTQEAGDDVILSGFSASSSGVNSPELSLQNDFFASAPAEKKSQPKPEWESSKMQEIVPKKEKTPKYPLKIEIKDVHVIWNLFDGYDWQRTREAISKTVEEVQTKAYERRARAERRMAYHQDDGLEEEAVSDFLFNSIYIGIPSHHDPRELSQNINQELYGVNPSDTESVATTTFTTTTSGRTGGQPRPKGKRLKLARSKHHKITFELSGLNATVCVLEPGSEETQSMINVQIKDLDVYDHIPTSTWKKFAMYDEDCGEREMGAPMVDLRLRNVRPVRDLIAEEIVMKVKLLPLRLHVDQDALDFITRFFAFKDDTVKPVGSPSDVPFIQRAEIFDIPVRLDFKPKRVDYAGLRSGRTTEFMNFIILDNASMMMRHTILYGISGFERLGEMLNDVWMPEIKRHQLPGVLAGLAPVRSLVDVGSGFKHLYEIPIREYRRDGRIVRSIGKGAAAFARTTGTELIKLGAKVAIGTQNVLQGAEGLLADSPEQHRHGGQGSSTAQQPGGWEEVDGPEEDGRHQISLYANQPAGVIQGLRNGYRSLSRDISIAREAIIAVPGEVRESTSATGAAKAIFEKAPIFIFRPAIGATKVIGQTLLGATNSLDPKNLRRMENKYKPDPKA